MKKYAISDIHGCNKTFKALLDKIQFSTSDELYLLGDYVDRGPDSKGVFDTIFDLKKNGYTVNCLRGNHEEMLLNAYDFQEDRPAFMRNGGDTTLKSFDCHSVEDIDDRYINFIRQLPYYFEVDAYILVHAGLNFKKKNPFEDPYNMIWIRQWYTTVDYKWLNNRLIIHGHTPISKEQIEDLYENKIMNKYFNIDCGCVYVNYTKSNKGHLIAFDMTDEKLIFQPCIDDVYF